MTYDHDLWLLTYAAVRPVGEGHHGRSDDVIPATWRTGIRLYVETNVNFNFIHEIGQVVRISLESDDG